MLVLTRRPGEAIIIANNIKVTVVSVGPGRVKLGIEAPPHVRVDRQEIHDKIEQASDVLAAVGTAAGDGQNTLVVTGPETEALSAPVVVNAGDSTPANAPTAPSLPVGKLDKYRLPRKPR
jgi:carbon storage regulator